MEIKKPFAVTLASAVALNCAGVGYGVQLFTDLPPATILGVTVTTSSVSAVNHVFYNTITDELIEAPVTEPIRITQS